MTVRDWTVAKQRPDGRASVLRATRTSTRTTSPTGLRPSLHTESVQIWSVGHGARPLDELLATLREGEIGVLADIRSFPQSRRHPHFGAAELAASLADAGIEYVHLRGLGGRREP